MSEYDDIINVNKDTIIDVVTNGPFESNFIKCVFSGKIGSNIVSSHFEGSLCCNQIGVINYHKDYSKYVINDANLYWQLKNKTIICNNLENQILKIKYKEKIINSSTIGKLILIIDNKLIIKVLIEDKKDDEEVYYVINIQMTEIVSMNEEFFKNNIIKIQMNRGHNFFNKEIKEYINLFRPKLNEIKGLKYTITINDMK